MTTSTASRGRRLLSIAAAAGFATTGLIVTSATAHAANGNTKVWVCKYVSTPGQNEVVKDGKNPIEVSANAIKAEGEVMVGYTFADGQYLSKVVQVGGSDPGLSSCESATPPPSVTPGDVPTAPPGTIPGDTPATPGKPGTPGTPGTGAPRTGGEGGGLPVGLVGGGVLLAGAGVLAAEAQRRRRAAARP